MNRIVMKMPFTQLGGCTKKIPRSAHTSVACSLKKACIADPRGSQVHGLGGVAATGRSRRLRGRACSEVIHERDLIDNVHHLLVDGARRIRSVPCKRPPNLCVRSEAQLCGVGNLSCVLQPALVYRRVATVDYGLMVFDIDPNGDNLGGDWRCQEES